MGRFFSLLKPRLLLVGGGSFSGLGSVSSRSSAFGGLGGVGGSAFGGLGGVSGGGSRSSGGSFSGGSGGRGRSGFFLLAASGDGQSNESSNQERLFHLLIPFMEEKRYRSEIFRGRPGGIDQPLIVAPFLKKVGVLTIQVHSPRIAGKKPANPGQQPAPEKLSAWYQHSITP